MNSLRLALRQLANQPMYAALSIGTLAIGIGCVATSFSALNTLLLRPLPWGASEDRLLWVSQTKLDGSNQSLGFTLPDRDDVLSQTQTLESMWVMSELTVIADQDPQPLRYLGTVLNYDAFGHLGVQPVAGRLLQESDIAPGAPRVALLSETAWQQLFERAPEAIGAQVNLNNTPTTIVGIMPTGWRYPETSDVWFPITDDMAKVQMAGRGAFYFDAHALLKPGFSLTEARAELTEIAARLATAHPETNAELGMTATTWREHVNGDATYFTILLFGAGLIVFFIACLNVANLQLARGSARAPEFSVRIALGATRWHLFRQLLIENLAMGLLGAAGGAIAGLWGIDFVVRSLAIDHPFWLVLDPDWRVMSFVALCGLIASLIFGLSPALRDSRPDVIASLKESSRVGLDQGPYGANLRSALVIGEIALALVLLVGAGLMMRSFLALRAIDPGYEAENVLTFRVGYPASMSQDPDVVSQFFSDLPSRLQRLPEVESAGATTALPGQTGYIDWFQLAPNRTTGETGATLDRVAWRVVTPHYFDAMSIPVLHGRTFTSDDNAQTESVAIIDQSVADQLGLAPEALLGRHLSESGELAKGSSHRATIIGVVGGIRHEHARPDNPGTVYLPHTQAPSNFMSVVVRTTGAPAKLADTVANEVLAVDPRLPVYHVLTLEQVVLRSIWLAHFFSRLFLTSGVIALLLACIGIYGVMTFNVTQRRHEIGLRMALGASARDVVRDVLRRGGELVVCGLAAGFLAAFALSSVLATSLYGVSPWDPPTFVLVPTLLASVALFACYLSSRRAVRIDPMVAMREE